MWPFILCTQSVYTLIECSSYCHDHVTSVEIHTPYEVTVTAKTSVGAGVPSSCVFFTEEGGEYIMYYIMYVPGSLMQCFVLILINCI